MQWPNLLMGPFKRADMPMIRRSDERTVRLFRPVVREKMDSFEVVLPWSFRHSRRKPTHRTLSAPFRTAMWPTILKTAIDSFRRFDVPTDDQHEPKTDMSLFEPDDEPPEPEELPYDVDIHHIRGTTAYEPVIDSVEAGLEYLEQHGTAEANDISRMMQLPRNSDMRGWDAESWYFERIAPVLASHPDVEWNDSYRFNPDDAIPESELAEFARSEWDLPEQANKSRTGTVTNPHYYYPQNLSTWYRMVRDRHQEHGIGVSKFELLKESLVSDYHTEKCFEYFETIPGIIPSSYESGEDKPDWEWTDDETESST